MREEIERVIDDLETKAEKYEDDPINLEAAGSLYYAADRLKELIE